MNLESAHSLPSNQSILLWLSVGFCAQACTFKERLLGSDLTGQWNAYYLNDLGEETALPYDRCIEIEAGLELCEWVEYYLVVERNLKGDFVQAATPAGSETWEMDWPFKGKARGGGDYLLKVTYNGGYFDEDLVCTLDETFLSCEGVENKDYQWEFEKGADQ